jgi:hypothetical protein
MGEEAGELDWNDLAIGRGNDWGHEEEDDGQED